MILRYCRQVNRFRKIEMGLSIFINTNCEPETSRQWNLRTDTFLKLSLMLQKHYDDSARMGASPYYPRHLPELVDNCSYSSVTLLISVLFLFLILCFHPPSSIQQQRIYVAPPGLPGRDYQKVKLRAGMCQHLWDICHISFETFLILCENIQSFWLTFKWKFLFLKFSENSHGGAPNPQL